MTDNPQPLTLARLRELKLPSQFVIDIDGWGMPFLWDNRNGGRRVNDKDAMPIIGWEMLCEMWDEKKVRFMHTENLYVVSLYDPHEVWKDYFAPTKFEAIAKAFAAFVEAREEDGVARG